MAERDEKDQQFNETTFFLSCGCQVVPASRESTFIHADPGPGTWTTRHTRYL